MPIPFKGFQPAPDRSHAAWVVQSMSGGGGVNAAVPDCFDAFARIHHRIHNGERWATFAPEYLVRGVEMYDYVGSKLQFIDGDGNLDPDDVDALVPLLAMATTTAQDCHYGLWDGWGWVRPGSIHRRSTRVWNSQADAAAHARALQDALEAEMAPVWSFAAACPVEAWWGGRTMILFDGPLEAVPSIGPSSFDEVGLQRQCPQWWWPADRAWFVGTDIEDPWTYVAGSDALIDTILSSGAWDSVAIEPTDRW